MTNYSIELGSIKEQNNTLSQKLINEAKKNLNLTLDNVYCTENLSLIADISQDEVKLFTQHLINDVLQKEIKTKKDIAPFSYYIRVGFLPGVTDNIARSAKDFFYDVLKRRLSDKEHIFSCKKYYISCNLSKEEVRYFATELLGNELINSIQVYDYNEWLNVDDFNNPAIDLNVTKMVTTINLNNCDLLQLSKEKTLSLSQDEMQIIADYINNPTIQEQRKKLGLNDITDAELECLAQTWSEHCKHKIFDANISYYDENGNKEEITSLYKTYIKQSTYEISQKVSWLVSVFKDNAGVISFNDKYDLVYKAETHNSPSALDPYGGAMTGIVGVNRDPMGTGIGAELLINTWGYCLGSPLTEDKDIPQGLLHPRRIRDGVHQGVIDGGNQSGIPYGLGWEYFEKRFIGKPLVYCGTIGLLPKVHYNQSGAAKTIKNGDLIVMAGGRIGKDGIHGATFSSEELHNDSPIQAVQIGDPITQKKLYDFIIEARDENLYRFITDNGAGGLSSSIGEMSTESNGCYMDLSKAPLKYQTLQPWEILISEAQERMSLAVPKENIIRLQELAKSRDVEISILGEFTNTGKFHIVYEDKLVCYLDLDFMHNGLPRMNLEARWEQKTYEEADYQTPCSQQVLLDLLSSLNISSQEDKYRQYDHEVKALSVLKPFIGIDCNIANEATCFMAEPLSQEGILLSYGIAPSYSDIDTYDMMASIIDMSIRRLISIGGSMEQIAGLDNFCWPDPVQSPTTVDGTYKLAQLVRANKALYDYCIAFQVPCISGKDSMKNDSTKGNKKISIPPTVLFSTIAPIKDVSKVIDFSLKEEGDLVYILGQTKNEMGGSQYNILQDKIGNNAPKVDAKKAKARYNLISQLTSEEKLNSLISPSFGGMAISFAKMVLASNYSLKINLNKIDNLTCNQVLFSESNSRFIITISPNFKEEFEQVFVNDYLELIGVVTNDYKLEVSYQDKLVIDLDKAALKTAYQTHLEL